jgi:hypothetical protein
MSDDNDVLDFVRRNPHLESVAGRPSKSRDARDEPEEGSCAAFGYLRGLHERSLGVEMRFRSGNRDWHPYSLLGSWRFNPSVGMLLKFTSDVVTLVLIRGSNLDQPTDAGGVDLIERGIGRQRVLWVREMEAEEIRQLGKREPIVDGIKIASFQSQEDVETWTSRFAPEFVRS